MPSFSAKSYTTGLLLLSWLVYATACTHQPTTDNHKKLAGLYKLYRMENPDSSGVWQEDHWAQGGESFIIYDGLGHMAVHISPKGYKDFDWMTEERAINERLVKEKIDTMSLNELKSAVTQFSSSYVYVANYIIADSANLITHNRITSSIPSIWGTTVKREFAFHGDTLILKNPTANRRLIWIRQQ